MAFLIEKGVPFPNHYRWADMEIGDSVHFETEAKWQAAKNSAHSWAVKHRPARFTCARARKRIWRIK